jgi:hypothetical protein
MSRESERKLDLLLRTRPFVPANEDLAQRIVVSAKSKKQHGHSTILHWMHGIFGDFFRYQPGYVLTLLLVIGVCLGFVTSGMKQEPLTGDLATATVQDFFYSVRNYY